MKVKCPNCKKETEYSTANESRPFCSERCKLIDLGQWAEGKFSIPVVDHSDIEDDEFDKLVDESEQSSSGSSDLH